MGKKIVSVLFIAVLLTGCNKEVQSSGTSTIVLPQPSYTEESTIETYLEEPSTEESTIKEHLEESSKDISSKVERVYIESSIVEQESKTDVDSNETSKTKSLYDNLISGVKYELDDNCMYIDYPLCGYDEDFYGITKDDYDNVLSNLGIEDCTVWGSSDDATLIISLYLYDGSSVDVNSIIESLTKILSKNAIHWYEDYKNWHECQSCSKICNITFQREYTMWDDLSEEPDCDEIDDILSDMDFECPFFYFVDVIDYNTENKTAVYKVECDSIHSIETVRNFLESEGIHDYDEEIMYTSYVQVDYINHTDKFLVDFDSFDFVHSLPSISEIECADLSIYTSSSDYFTLECELYSKEHITDEYKCKVENDIINAECEFEILKE